MSSGQPLVAADVPPTPSTVTSPSPAPEPEVQAEQKVTIRIKPSLHALYASSRLNKFGTTDKTCTTPGCDWVVEEPWLSGLCVVCEQKQHSDLEKERIQSILRKRAKDESVRSACEVCSRAVILPSAVGPAQHIICTICERKMLSSNPIPAPAVISTSPSVLPSPVQPNGQPTGQPPLTIAIRPRPNPAAGRPNLPLTIKLSAKAVSSGRTPSTATPTSAEDRSRHPNAKAVPRRRVSRRTPITQTGPGFPNEFPLLLSRWAETEKAFTILSNKPHLNDKGEYLIPCLPVPTSRRVAATDLVMQAAALSPVTPSSYSFSSYMRLSKKPVSKFPIYDYPGRNSLGYTGPASPSIPKDRQPSSDPERPRLTLRLPSLSSLEATNTTTLQPQPQPSPSGAELSIPSPTTRLCRQVGCKTSLPPTYQWIFCTECLQKPLKSLSPLDEEATPRISRRVSEPIVQHDQDRPASPRRASEPTVIRVVELENPALRIPRLLKPAPFSSDDQKTAKKDDIAARCALPTPPPSSRQSSPSALHVPSDPPSSPEIPLCSPDAPRYTRQDEKEDDIWEDDLSDLTPLESSDNSDSSDEEDNAKPADAERGRAVVPGGGSQKYVCIRSRCHNLLVPWSKWKMCHTCRLKFRERSRERKDSLLFAVQGQVGPADGDSQRKCALRTCKNVLPHMSLYRWKLCEACRTRTRRQTRKRRYGEVGLASDEDGEDPESIMRRRRSSTVNFKKLKLMFKGETVASVEARKQVKEPVSVIVQDNALRFSIYQTPQLLLDTLRERLFSFITATTHYLRFKMISKMTLENVQPTVFSFEGEFSVIADPSGGEVGSKIELVQAEIGKALGMQFTLTSFRVQPNGTIIGQYACMHEILVPLPTTNLPASNTPPESAMESGSTLLPSPADTCEPKDVAVKSSPEEDTPTTKDTPAKELSDDSAVVQASDPGDSSEQKPTLAEIQPKATLESISPTNDATSQASPQDVPTNFDVIAKCMAGELKVSILWDRSHRYFPGLRTIVQLNLVG